ncbi:MULTISPECIES: leucyl aminopeptidase [unclassified Pseudoxanthomonas]|uniref:leucyl aminopeptidase n=1 Tax=unclassified Pseudoxanthomonas TaxID=2645906 RepID=UPI0016126452|nr:MULTISPECIES: leucyl aminopeptidase [unclassified Pseudoxanthomonas]MBB3275557.1 leucyl aminopeptidase [Pseudoxanthomonas sp. OG2]MBD9377142.1 leucyl aminopeptidase [Pseudoxanthomonas sp. PXM04]MBV7473356.1 leucyl aminopeptidase [Pseudoxanthomonas sp. PXM05]
MTLEFTLNHDAPASAGVDCVVVGAYGDKTLTPAAQAIDAASGGRLAALVARGDISGKTGKTALLHDLPGVAAPRVLVVGLGEAAKFGVPQYLKAVGDAARTLKAGPSASALFTLAEVEVKDRDAAWKIRQAVIAADHACYRYTATLGKKKNDEPGLARFAISGEDAQALAQGAAIAAGVQFTRELGNLPPNICNPAYLAEQSQKFAADNGAECEVLDEAQMETLGMGSLLAVARGSANRPRLIVLKWNNGGDAKPFVLVGKGITFDTGGVNLKTQGGIEEMKYDMLGAGSVLGAFVAAVKMQLPLNLVVIVPAVENAIDGNAYRPSDVITSMSGKTIEVGNTDAEGRLILCDALTYAQRFEPQALVDAATLTGACIVALGRYATGLMSKHDDLSNELLAAGEQVFDRAWRLPLWDEYQTQLDSTFADVYNIGGRWAGAITAGCFLARFTEGQRWAHLDIAGVANDEGKRGMATGRPVGLLAQWLLDRAGI